MTTEVYKIETPEDIPAAAARGVEVLAAGGLVAFPTETVYGLGASAASDKAMRDLRRLKQRPARPFTVHIGEVERALAYVSDPPHSARRLMRKAWPGPVTIILPTAGRLATADWNGRIAERICHKDTIALRCPDHPLAQYILIGVRDPVVVPSANPAGKKPPVSAEEVLADFDGQIDLVIDGGRSPLGESSTVVSFDAIGRFDIQREGAYRRETLEELMRKQVLFVCTGNTCRSPMAEGLARMELARRVGCKESQLEECGWRVVSAGTMSLGGSPATPEAVEAAGKLGANIRNHVNQPLTGALIESSDLVFCMTGQHVEEVTRLSPASADRVGLLDPAGDILDPIGASGEVYHQVAKRIHAAIQTQMDEILS
jgi:L-threonylcarbamoyladenylate synthase